MKEYEIVAKFCNACAGSSRPETFFEEAELANTDEFVRMKHSKDFDNFKKGFTTAGMSMNDMIKLAKKNGANEEEIKKLHHKLTYKYVKGGVILADTDFTIK